MARLMRKQFFTLLGLLLSSQVPAAAQITAPGIVAPIARAPMATTPLAPASFLLTQGTGNHKGQFSLTLAGAYARELNPDELSPMDETKTLTLTRSSLLLVQLWGGRMQVGAFQSTLHMRNVLLSPFDNGAVGSHLAELSYPGVPRSVDLSGLSLSLHFHRDAVTGRPVQAWRRMSRILGAVLN
jgi:hypothetical protein